MTETMTLKQLHDLPVHPCAAIFPLMSAAKLGDLSKDIKANGLREPVTVLALGAQRFLLDGRNRLAAAEQAQVVGHQDVRVVQDVDPAKYVISKNIRRRHLTKEQQAELILRTIKAGKTAGRAVVAMPVPRDTRGRVLGSTKDPDLTAAVEEGQQHGISRRTIQRAQGKLAGRTPAPRRKAGIAAARPVSEAIPLAPVVPIDAEAAITAILVQLELAGCTVEHILVALTAATNDFRASHAMQRDPATT